MPKIILIKGPAATIRKRLINDCRLNARLMSVFLILSLGSILFSSRSFTYPPKGIEDITNAV